MGLQFMLSTIHCDQMIQVKFAKIYIALANKNTCSGYLSVDVINFSPSQSDHIRQLPMHN